MTLVKTLEPVKLTGILCIRRESDKDVLRIPAFQETSDEDSLPCGYRTSSRLLNAKIGLLVSKPRKSFKVWTHLHSYTLHSRQVSTVSNAGDLGGSHGDFRFHLWWQYITRSLF